jgi:hypothetical protein
LIDGEEVPNGSGAVLMITERTFDVKALDKNFPSRFLAPESFSPTVGLQP